MTYPIKPTFLPLWKHPSQKPLSSPWPCKATKRETCVVSSPFQNPTLALFLLLLCRLQKAGQPFFPSLVHSCSCHITFKKGWTTLLSIPSSPLFPSKTLHTPLSLLSSSSITF